MAAYGAGAGIFGVTASEHPRMVTIPSRVDFMALDAAVRGHHPDVVSKLSSFEHFPISEVCALSCLASCGTKRELPLPLTLCRPISRQRPLRASTASCSYLSTYFSILMWMCSLPSGATPVCYAKTSLRLVQRCTHQACTHPRQQ